MTNTINRNIIQNLPGLGVCWVVQHNGVFGQEIEKLLQSKIDISVDFGTIPPPLISALVAAEELNDDQAHRLGKLEQGIQKFLDGDEPVRATLCVQCIEDYFAALLKEHNNEQ